MPELFRSVSKNKKYVFHILPKYWLHNVILIIGQQTYELLNKHISYMVLFQIKLSRLSTFRT